MECFYAPLLAADPGSRGSCGKQSPSQSYKGLPCDKGRDST